MQHLWYKIIVVCAFSYLQLRILRLSVESICPLKSDRLI